MLEMMNSFSDVRLKIFEEFRFAAELLGAELVFLIPFAKRKENFMLRLSAGILCFLLFAQLYFFLPKGGTKSGMPGLDMVILSVVWYSFLVILSMVCCKCCFKIGICDLVFFTIAGFAAQHIEYALINELLAMQLVHALTEHFWLYTVVSLATCTFFYMAVYRLFGSKMVQCGGELFEDRPLFILFSVLLLAVLVASCFTEQHLFRFGDVRNGILVVMTDVLICTLILLVQYGCYHSSQIYRERRIVEQLLHERQKQYLVSKENMEAVTHKCHDLKHQIHALEQMSGGQRSEFLEDIKKSVLVYDSMAQTGHEVLNTLLTEKSNYCERHSIRLSIMADGAALGFMDVLDLYTLFGNALDNAIECVRQYPQEKRNISLSVSVRRQFLNIEMSNYFEGTDQAELKDGIPVTTKEDSYSHGYGIKSIYAVVKKYQGEMEITMERSMFVLGIVIPVP